MNLMSSQPKPLAKMLIAVAIMVGTVTQVQEASGMPGRAPNSGGQNSHNFIYDDVHGLSYTIGRQNPNTIGRPNPNRAESPNPNRAESQEQNGEHSPEHSPDSSDEEQYGPYSSRSQGGINHDGGSNRGGFTYDDGLSYDGLHHQGLSYAGLHDGNGGQGTAHNVHSAENQQTYDDSPYFQNPSFQNDVAGHGLSRYNNAYYGVGQGFHGDYSVGQGTFNGDLDHNLGGTNALREQHNIGNTNALREGPNHGNTIPFPDRHNIGNNYTNGDAQLPQGEHYAFHTPGFSNFLDPNLVRYVRRHAERILAESSGAEEELSTAAHTYQGGSLSTDSFITGGGYFHEDGDPPFRPHESVIHNLGTSVIDTQFQPELQPVRNERQPSSQQQQPTNAHSNFGNWEHLGFLPGSVVAYLPPPAVIRRGLGDRIVRANVGDRIFTTTDRTFTPNDATGATQNIGLNSLGSKFTLSSWGSLTERNHHEVRGEQEQKIWEEGITPESYWKWGCGTFGGEIFESLDAETSEKMSKRWFERRGTADNPIYESQSTVDWPDWRFFGYDRLITESEKCERAFFDRQCDWTAISMQLNVLYYRSSVRRLFLDGPAAWEGKETNFRNEYLRSEAERSSSQAGQGNLDMPKKYPHRTFRLSTMEECHSRGEIAVRRWEFGGMGLNVLTSLVLPSGLGGGKNYYCLTGCYGVEGVGVL